MSNIIEEALRLSPSDRAELAERLWESLDNTLGNEIDRAWLEEVDRRENAFEAGQTELISSEKAREYLATKYRWS